MFPLHLKTTATAFAVFALIFAPATAGEAIPDLAKALLEAAYETGDPDQITAVASAAAQVFPDFADAISADANVKIAELTPLVTEGAETPSDKEGNERTSGGFMAVNPWDGKVTASAAFSSGNSENTTLGLAFDAQRTAGDFTHNIAGFVDIASSEGDQTQQRWGGSYQLDYLFSEYTYSYGRFSYEEDAFSGFDYRLFAGVGLGHFFVKSEPLTWKVEGGPGYRYSPIDDTRLIEENFAVYASSETDWLIREGVTLEQDLNVTWTDPTTTFLSVTALSTALTELFQRAFLSNIAMKPIRP